MDENVKFRSGDGTCAAVLTRPEGRKGKTPLVIMAGGWCYTKEIVMPHYAKAFHKLGCATLVLQPEPAPFHTDSDQPRAFDAFTRLVQAVLTAVICEPDRAGE